MAHCIHLVLIYFHIKVVWSIEDYYEELMGFCRENSLHSLVVYDSDDALRKIPYYFSSHALKLNWNNNKNNNNKTK